MEVGIVWLGYGNTRDSQRSQIYKLESEVRGSEVERRNEGNGGRRET